MCNVPYSCSAFIFLMEEVVISKNRILLPFLYWLRFAFCQIIIHEIHQCVLIILWNQLSNIKKIIDLRNMNDDMTRRLVPLQRFLSLQQWRIIQPGLVSCLSVQLSTWGEQTPWEQLLTTDIYSTRVAKSLPRYSTFWYINSYISVESVWQC